ncbi:unnamed protein product [Spodoptera littoralis]|uniref:Uncharacterized protein n=1 Tax=Spodoptera littoralis TaxID=7109 RepID=A0A9P0I672_SPOLI|nr:unnamed protein product [Spodoptera littoralis]
MVILTGKNLGERHKHLNAKVKEAREKLVDFDELKQKPEQSDVDKLFKIALASKYMNIDYIVEVLKCGDPLYISKALKCDWMYDDKYAHIINPEYLQNNIIPFMSTKMKKKMLTGISIHVRNESRAAEFYNYCMDIGCTNIAIKFLYFTSDNFKLEVLKDPSKRVYLPPNDEDGADLKHLIGSSFTLAEVFLEFDFINTNRVLSDLRYLYTFSEDKYLNLLEKYTAMKSWQIERFLGLRISKSIMTKHKDRVLKKSKLYVSILNKNAIIKYSTAEDAKMYAIAFFPNDINEFWWNKNYLSDQKYYLDKITTGKFQFIKEIFTSKFPEEEFEMQLRFYERNCYEIMTAEEKETWALQQIASGKEILGKDQDYKWYKFINFEKAFKEMKKLVLITPDRTKRADMMLILVESAKNQRELETLLKHFYERHVNEQKYVKENFLDKVMNYFNVYDFDTDCWEALNIMFHNLEVYSSTDFISKSEYRIIALIYHIIHDIQIPQALRNHIASGLHFYLLKNNTEKLTTEQTEKVFQYLFNLYMDKIREFENVPYDDEVKGSLRKYIFNILDLLTEYEKTKEHIPELVNHFIKLDWSEFKHHRLVQSASEHAPPLNLLRDLKSDSKLLIEHLPLVKKKINESFTFNISTVLKKLRIYFSQDVAKECLIFFNSWLDEEKLWHKEAQAIVHALFQLGGENFKVDLMKKFAPKEATIDHSKIDEKLLRIQMAICSHVLYSRPPVPLECILMYLKGDYVPFGLPMFNALLSNLPLPLCMNFVENLLDKPVSVQKHGIRLAFQCFDTQNFNTVILRAWKKKKNVSLRAVIFDALYNKITMVTSDQEALFNTLKSIILTLRHDDDDEIFNLITSCKLPEHFSIESIEVAWKVVRQFPPKLTNLNRMYGLISCITKYVQKLRQDFVYEIVDTFIASEFKPNEGDAKEKLSLEAISLIESKWRLTVYFIVYLNDDDLDKKIELTRLILMKCFMSHEENKHSLIQTGMRFISQLENASYSQTPSRFVNINSLMQSVIQTLQGVFTMEEIYLQIWELQLGIVARKAINKLAHENTVHVFAKEVGNLVKEHVDKGLFFYSFMLRIHSLLHQKIINVTNTLEHQDVDDFCVKLCRELLLFEMIEIYWLVLYLLPVYSSDLTSKVDRNDYVYITNTLNNLNNKEIRFYMFNKFAGPGQDLILN